MSVINTGGWGWSLEGGGDLLGVGEVFLERMLSERNWGIFFQKGKMTLLETKIYEK